MTAVSILFGLARSGFTVTLDGSNIRIVPASALTPEHRALIISNKSEIRQHDGDSDLEGVLGWCVEVKRNAEAGRADIARWWLQATQQAAKAAAKASNLPVLFFRVNRDQWRAVWPLEPHLAVQSADMWSAYGWSVEGSPQAWAAAALENRSSLNRSLGGHPK